MCKSTFARSDASEPGPAFAKEEHCIGDLCTGCAVDDDEADRAVQSVRGDGLLRNIRLHLATPRLSLPFGARLQILSVFSPNVVQVWEAALTLLFFFLLVFIAYATDVRLWEKKERPSLQRELELVQKEDTAASKKKRLSTHSFLEPVRGLSLRQKLQTDAEVPQPTFDNVRNFSKDISRVYPTLSPEEQAKILAYRVAQTQVP